MSDPTATFETYAPLLNHHGLVPFAELIDRGFVHDALCWLRRRCAWFMAGCALYACVGVCMRGVDLLHGSEAERSPEGTVFLWGGLLVGVVAYLLRELFGSMLRRRRGPPPRLVDVSYFGIRVATRHGAQPIHAPVLDAHGRVLLPWTNWLDVLECRPDNDGLVVEVRGVLGPVVLALPRRQAEDVAALATVLHRLARRRITGA